MPALNCALAVATVEKRKRLHNSPRTKTEIVRLITGFSLKTSEFVIFQPGSRRIGYRSGTQQNLPPSQLTFFTPTLSTAADQNKAMPYSRGECDKRLGDT